MNDCNAERAADARGACSHDLRRTTPKSRPYAIAAAALSALTLAAVYNRHRADEAERDNPPAGRFVEVDGVRLHYVERGTGEPLVLLHGNGSMVQDFESSGLLGMAAKKYRVIAFDRPGFGHSERPRSVIWTPETQADLIHAALAKIGVRRAIVLGHSWGASVAAGLALQHPRAVAGLVLASGYYYPSARADVVFASGPAVPVVGDIIRYTLAPILGRAMWPIVLRKIFGPAPTPHKFAGFPKEMALRPSQIRATAAEAALMIPNAIAMQGDYADLKMPVVIISGDDDRLIDIDDQSARLHEDIAQSSFHRVRGAGHMVHQTAPGVVMAAIDEAAAAAARQAEALPRARLTWGPPRDSSKVPHGSLEQVGRGSAGPNLPMLDCAHGQAAPPLAAAEAQVGPSGRRCRCQPRLRAQEARSAAGRHVRRAAARVHQAAIGEAGHGSARRGALGARTQVRWVPHARADRSRARQADHCPVRPRLDRQNIRGWQIGWKRCRVATAYLDGELCAVRPDGTTSFSLMQAATESQGGRLVYFAFDLLHLDGEDPSSRNGGCRDRIP